MTWSPRRPLKGLIGTVAVALALMLSVSPAYADDATPPTSGTNTTSNEPGSVEVPTTGPVTDPVVDPVTDPVIDPVTDPLSDGEVTAVMYSSAPVSTKVFTARAGWAYKQARAAAPRTTKGFYKTIWYARWYGKNVAEHKYQWTGKQMRCLTNLWKSESSWRYKAKGSRGRFLGIPQLFKGNLKKMGVSIGFYMKTPELQIQLGTRYISGRYGTPCNALTHFNKKRWY